MSKKNDTYLTLPENMILKFSLFKIFVEDNLCATGQIFKNQSIENAGVAFVKVANERKEFFDKTSKQ